MLQRRLLLATASALLFFVARPHIARAALRLRIRRLHLALDALRAHAAAARALLQQCSHAMDTANRSDKDALRDRVQALRHIQRRTLAALEGARARVDANLLQLRASNPSVMAIVIANPSDALVYGNERRVRADIAAEVAHAFRLLGVAAAVSDAVNPRARLLREEQRAVSSICTAARQPRELRVAVRALRALESNLDFQAELLEAQRAVSTATGYSGANFAYGSTPLQSWLVLFDCDPVRAALASAPPPGGLRYLVLGSSLGSLVLYGACVHGLVSRGIELLPVLARHATQLSDAAGVVGVSFDCADMLTSDLGQPQIVLLASQCWDPPLIATLRAKLLRELPLGALVLDYTAALGQPPEEAQGHDGPAAPATRAFELQCTVRAPVSWDEAHCFWVWRLVSV